MPSMWKKQKGGSRISRLVSDLQTTPKRGASLVVETGFPTSIADLFVKNHDKLKKSSKKRHRSKHPPPSSSPSTPVPSSYDHQPLPSPGFPSPPSLFETPSCSFDGDNDDFVLNHSDSCVSRKKNPRRVQSGRDHYDYDDETEEEEEEEEGNWRVLGSKRSFLLLVMKGVVVVVVAIYTRSFVLGVSIGVFLFCMLEYLGKSVFGLFWPCKEGVTRELRSFSRSSASKPIIGNEKKPQEGVITVWNGDIIGSKRDKGGENGVVSKPMMEIVVPSRKIGVTNGNVELEDGDSISKEGEMEQQNETCTPKTEKFRRLEEEFRKTIRQVEAFYPCYSESTCPSPVPQGLEGTMDNDRQGSEGPEMVGDNNNDKAKKKKFWGKFVRKQSNRKKNKKGKRQASDSEEAVDCVEEISPESEDGNELDDEQEMSVRDAGSSSLSLPSLDEEESEERAERIGVANRGSPEMLCAGEGTAKSRRIINKNYRHFKCLGILGIALAGLTGGRVFALALTVISCLLFKIIV